MLLEMIMIASLVGLPFPGGVLPANVPQEKFSYKEVKQEQPKTDTVMDSLVQELEALKAISRSA